MAPAGPRLAGVTAMHGSLSTHGHFGATGEADTGLSSSVSLLHLPRGSCGCEQPQRWLRHIKGWHLLYPCAWEEMIQSLELNLLKGPLSTQSRSAEPTVLEVWAGWWGDHRGGGPCLGRAPSTNICRRVHLGLSMPVDVDRSCLSIRTWDLIEL